jgi:hypothetical protein
MISRADVGIIIIITVIIGSDISSIIIANQSKQTLLAATEFYQY